MFSPYVLIYQYFDAEEVRLYNQISYLRERICRSDPRHVPESDYEELIQLRSKLDYVRKICDDVLNLLKSYDMIQ